MGKRRLQPGESTPTPAYAGPIVDWLTKKRVKVPAPLAQAHARGVLPDAALADEMAWALALLPALKERERRSLIRYAQRQHDAPAQAEQLASGAGGCSSDSEPDCPRAARAVLDWPADVTYSNDYAWDERVPAAVLLKYGPSLPADRAAGSSSDDRIRVGCTVDYTWVLPERKFFGCALCAP